MFKKKFPSLSSLGSDGNTSFLRAARAGHLDKVLEQLKNNVDINTSNANGLNALHLASKDGHIHVVTELLKRGANVDSATKKGNTALHIASLAGQEEVVKLLVEHGASVNVQSQNGFTPLYMAAQENHDNVVRYLLSNGANQSLATEDGFTPLAVAMQQGHDKVVAVLLENDTRGKVRLPALHIAAKKDDCKAAALLLQNEHNPDVTSKSGFTPLHIASHYGNQDIANLLLNKGADVNYSAKHNITPLHVAAKWGKSNMVGLLLEKGANIESKTRDGLTPLHCAARSGHEQVVDMLLERGAPISSKTKNGLAPLHMSSQGDHVDAARILLYHRAPVDEVTVDYLTALHVAAHCGHARVAKLLLDRKADPNARALNGFTPLHIACKKNRIKVVELLLKHGASIEATTESGLTPLHVASFMGCMNIVIYLLQNEANPDVPTVRGETPLHLAARANQTDIIRILLRNGAQVDARAREQQTPLHIAARLGNVDIVMLLLQHGAAVDSTTKDLYTALHIAAKEGQDEVAQVLLENGASPTATTKKGFTPLHLASKYGNMKVASLLLQRDAPVDAQGKNGVTPLHVASHYDHQNVALLLLDKGASPHATAKNGHTPLHIAAKKNQMDIATTLLEYGAKADIESKAGFTPLHLSAQEGHIDMTSLLIDHQADTNHKAKNGLTPLHLCAQEDRVNVATVLLKNGAEVDATTKAGYTPLHVASHFGQLNMVRFLVDEGAKVGATTSVGYTPLHQAAQQGHSTIVNTLLESGAPPNMTTNQGQTALSIAQKLGYISVVESLKGVTEPTTIINTSMDEKYKVVSPETMQETFMSDSEDEGGEDTLLSEQPYRYLTVDEMKSLGDDSLPIDVTRDERADSNRECMTAPPTAVDDTISPQHLKESYSEFGTPDNVDISRHPLHVGFLVSFLVDARGGAMRGCRHSGVRVIVPPRRASQPMRVTCRYLKRDKLSHPPPLMEGEALASRILELGPVGAKFLGPVMIEVPHFGSLRGKEREIVILRSDNGETWREHTVDANEDAVQDILSHSFDKEEISQLEDAGRTTRILTTDFPHYFAVVTRVRQEVHAIGPEGGMVSSSVVPQVQAVFPQGALTKKIKVGLQAQPISAELAAKLLGNRVAVSPIVTVEPRRRKFHKPITLTIPKPQAANKGMINQYSGDAPTLRLLCSITGGTTRAQWEDVTGSTPFTFVNDCVSFTTTVSARFWLMDCRNVVDATKMATELYREAIHVPFMAKFVVFAKRVGELEARLRVFCMTDDKEDKTLEHQEHFTEVAKSRDVEVLEGKSQYVEFAGNLIPVTKSGEQLQLGFRAFRENRLPFTVRVKDPHADTIGRTLFMREPKVPKGEPPQQPICILNIVLPEEIIPETGVLDHDLHKYNYIKDSSGLESYQRADLRLSDISNLLGEDWVRLAGELNISTSDINRLKTEYPNSDAQQGLAMLRLWLQKSGNKAQANTLEAALSRLGRDDIIQQCVFNIDQTGFDLLKEELGPSRDASLKRDIRVENVYTDQDIIKDSESIEELSRLPHRKAGESAERDDKEERKYVAEEKEVEEKKSVLERRKEIEGRLLLDKEKLIEKQVTKVVVEETIITQKQKIAEDLTEKEIAEEKKLSPEEQEPSDLTFEQKRLSFEQGKKLIELKPDKKKTDVRKETDEKITSEDIKVAESEIDETSIPFQEKRLSFEQGLKAAELKREERSVDDQRRDSELFEGVSQGLVSLDTVVTSPPQDLLSPKVSKTPPPSPAEFKDTTGAVPWQDDRQAIPAKIEPVQDWTTKRKPDSGSDAEKLGSTRDEKHTTYRKDEVETGISSSKVEDVIKPEEQTLEFTSFYEKDTIVAVKSFIEAEAEAAAYRNISEVPIEQTQILSVEKPSKNLDSNDDGSKPDEKVTENSSKTEKSEKPEKSFVGKVSKKIFGVFKKDTNKDKCGKSNGDKEKSKGKGSHTIESEKRKEKLEENITIETVLETNEKELSLPGKGKGSFLKTISDTVIKASDTVTDVEKVAGKSLVEGKESISNVTQTADQIKEDFKDKAADISETQLEKVTDTKEKAFEATKLITDKIVEEKEHADGKKYEGIKNTKDKAISFGEIHLKNVTSVKDKPIEISKIEAEKILEDKKKLSQDVDKAKEDETVAETVSSTESKVFKITKSATDKLVECKDEATQETVQIKEDIKIESLEAISEKLIDGKEMVSETKNLPLEKINGTKEKDILDTIQTNEDPKNKLPEVNKATVDKISEVKEKSVKLADSKNDEVQEDVGKINKGAFDKLSSAKDSIFGFTKSAKDKAVESKNKAMKEAIHTKEDVKDKIYEIGKDLSETLSDSKSTAIEITDTTSGKVTKGKDKISMEGVELKDEHKSEDFYKTVSGKMPDLKLFPSEITKTASDKFTEGKDKITKESVVQKKYIEDNTDQISEDEFGKLSCAEEPNFGLMKSATDKVVASKDKPKQEAADTKEDVKGRIDKIGKNMSELESVVEVSKTTASKVTELKEKIETGVILVKDELKDKSEDFDKVLSENMSDLNGALPEITKTASDKCTKDKDKITKEVFTKKNDLEDNTDRISKSTFDKLSSAKDSLFSLAKSATDKVVKNKDKVKQEVVRPKEDDKDRTDKIGEKMSETKSHVVELSKTESKDTEGKEKIRTADVLVKDKLKVKSEDFDNTVSGKISDLKVASSEIAKTVSDQITEGKDKITKEAVSRKQELEDNTAQISKGAIDELSSAKVSLFGFAKSGTDKVVERKDNAIKQAASTKDDLIDKTGKQLSDSMSTAKEISKTTADKVTASKDQITKDTKVELKDKTKDLSKTLSESLLSAKTNVTVVSTSATDNINEVKDEVSEAATKMNLKSLVDINSKSVGEINENKDKMIPKTLQENEDIKKDLSGKFSGIKDRLVEIENELSAKGENEITQKATQIKVKTIDIADETFSDHQEKKGSLTPFGDYVQTKEEQLLDNACNLSDVRNIAKDIVDETIEKLTSVFPDRQANPEIALKRPPIETISIERTTTEESSPSHKHLSEPDLSNAKKEDEKFTNILIDMLIEQESMKTPVPTDSENQVLDSTKTSVTSTTVTKSPRTVIKNEGKPTKEDSDNFLSPKSLKEKHLSSTKPQNTDLRSSASDDVLEYFGKKSEPLSTVQTEEHIISYVTTPTLQRRGIGGSQRLSREERPALRDVSHLLSESSSDEEENAYIVTEPIEKSPQSQRKVTFRFDSEEDPDWEPSSDNDSEIDVQEMTPSPVPPVEIEKKTYSDSSVELGDETEANKKIKRVERRFERMASETLEASDPAVSNVDHEFQRMISQLSNKEVDACVTAWDEEGLTPSSELDSKDSTSGDLEDGLEQLPQESSRNIDTQHGLQSGSDSSPPKPPPRIQKSDTQEDTTEKSEEDIQDYSIRKKFWEQMSSSGSTDSDIKSQRSQDSATPPIPRPRSSIVSSAPLLKSEAESDTETTATTLSDSTVRIKNIPQDSVSKQSFTGSSDASDKEEGSEPEAIDLSGSNTTQSVLTTAATVVSEITDERPSKDNQTATTDSSDSEAEYIAKVGGGTLSYENNGFVADEEELKGVLEKNKINGTAISEPFSKRIVQQKSESAVPVAATRKTVYERSVSLPTENITDVSENSVRARKRFFEQQIKKEMVVDQLMTQLEEESSPEHKSIHNQTVDRTTANTQAMVNRQIHSHIFSHELEEQIESLVPEDKNIIEIKNELIEEVKPVTVKEIASAFGKVDAKKSVKRTDSVSYEAEVIKIQQSDQILQKGISGKDETQFEHVDQLDKKVDVKQICDVFEQKVQEDLLPQKISLDESLLESVDQKLATKEAESIKELTGEMTRIESIIDIEKKDINLGSSIPEYIHESIEEALQYKSEVICQPSDSLEVHIDKSEIEATEKEAELDDEFKSLEKESKEDYACTEEDLIPSITVTLSGKQRTESYSQGESEDTQSESDITPEEAKNKENVKAIQELDEQEVERISDSQISKGKQPHVYTPEEHIPDTVWEVPVQQEPETNDQEMVQDIPIEKQVIVEKDEDDSQQFSLTEVSAVPEAKKSLQLTQKPYPLTKVEARKIAEEVVENIESEIAKRSDMITDLDETISPAPSAHLAETQVSDYFKHLSDREEIEKKLFESVLAKKQREHINKLTRTDTTTSSMEITDEDLRSSGVETDISPIEVQGSKLYQVEDRSEDDATEDFTKIEKDLDDEFEQVDLEKDFKNIQLKLHEKDHKYNQVEGIDSQKGGETLKYEDSCKSVKSETMKVIELENDLGVEMHFQTDELIEEKLKKLKEKEVVEKTLAEVKESLEAAQEELIEEHKKKKEIIQKKQSPSEFEFKVLTLEKTTDESIQESSFEETGLSLTTTSTINDKPIVGNIESKIVETEVSGATLHAHGLKETTYIRDGDKEMLSDVKQDMFAQKDKSVKDIKVEETISIKHQDLEMKSSKRGSASYSDDEEKIESAKFEEKLLITAEGVLKKTVVEEKEESSDKKGESFDYDSKTEEVDGNKSVIKEEHKKEEHTLEKVEEIKSSIEGTEHVSKDGLFIKEKSVEKYQISTTTKTESREEYHSESNVQICTEIEADEAMVKELLSQGFIQQEGDDIDDICKKTFSVIEKQEIKRTYSEESQKSSQDESVKSPVGTEGGISSSSSSGRRGDSDTLHTSERPEVVMRKHKTVESVAHRRSDRRSGTDYEPYSSSGESHYHSFEQTSESIRTPSRPCSSDMEALVAGIGTTGSSEYESAMSHEVSGRSLTSHDYHTAVSSLSSRESMKSLDSESSGNLASVEISSEASETLVPSAMELEKDMEGAIGPIEEEGITFKTEKHFIEPYDSVIPHHIICGESPPISQSSSTGKQFEQSPSFDISGEEVSGEDNASKPCIEKDTKGQDSMLGMKRSHEMIFQPEPQPIITESPMSESSSHEEKFSSSLDDVGSVLSLSSISDTAAIRTVIELSRTESDKMDGSATSDQLSMTVSATSEQSFSSGSREDVDKVPHVTKSEITTATQSVSQDGEVSSVTLTTSTVKEGGIQSVSTQVTSQTEVDILSGKSDGLIEEGYTCSNGPTQVDYNSEYDDVREIKKRPGHRRTESKSFKPSMIPVLAKKQDSAPKNLDEYVREDAAESDKYTEPAGLTLKEGRNDEKKDVDEAERIEDESYQTEADQGFHRDLREGRRMVEDVSSLEEDQEELQELDSSRPQSQVSKSDSESGHRPMSAGFSDDRPDSELAELLKQCSSDAGSEDPIERPKTPEPIEESEIKDDTPEFSSEAQASVTELEMEYSGAFSRSIEYESHVSPIREKAGLNFEGWEQHFSDHEDELAEAEAAFQMVPHISPAIVSTLPATIPEDPIAEKHELETREMDLKEELRRRAAQMEATSPGSIPDITVTQHMTPLIDRAFHYPDLELEEEIAKAASTPQTPASVSSRASSETETDQGREYILEEEEGDDVIAEELDLAEISVTADERTVFESKDEVLERDSATDSPGSDSFEMLEKPDIADEFVIIEEVGKEAHEQDCEGKSVQIKKKRVIKKVDVDDEEITSPPAPSTRMTEIKYYPSGGAQNDNVGPFPFDSDSPPTNVDGVTSGEVTSLEGTPPSDDEPEFEHEVEAGKKWIEMQFHGDHATAVYGYDIEYEHGPLEDIKEEDANDLEQSSSRFGSLGSQVSHSVGSFGSVNKASLGSTPDYDVLAGRKYFTRSGEHDDVSMSSLQEFERLENLIAMESSKNKSHGSQDSLGSGNSSGNSKRFGTAKSGGDDVSVGSLKEFEGLETACLEAAKIEIKAKEEEALLSEIDEGHESQASESESCETISAGGIKGGDSDSDDYEKRMFEIDEIIRQAQSNVERFIDVKDKPEDGTDSSILDRTESVGRGDSLEEVARVPDLDLDAPLYSLASVSVTSYSGKNYVQQWKEREDEMLTSTDSLDVKTTISKSGALDPLTTSTDSLDPKTLPDKDAMSASTDSIEYHLQEKKSKTKGEIMTDSIEIPCDKTSMLTSTDSLEMDVVKHMTSDSIDEEEDICGHIGSIQDQSSSSGREGDLSSSGKEDSCEQNRMPPPRAELLLGSTDSLEPSSSTATHATYQYETDSMMSSSFTSGGSNTMVSSTETLDASAKAGIWFEDGRPYVTEVIEPVTDDDFSHTIHRTVELPPEIHKVTFRGPDAEQALREYIDNFAPGEDTTETQEVDADGNVHIKRVIQRRVIVRPEEMGGPTTDITGPELEKYLRHLSDQQLGEEPTTDVVDSDFTHLMSSITGSSSPSHSTETHRTYVTRHITSSIPISLEPSQKEITTPDIKDDSSADEAKKTSKSSAEPGAREGEENLFELAAGFRDTPPTDETDSLKKSPLLPKPQ